MMIILVVILWFFKVNVLMVCIMSNLLLVGVIEIGLILNDFWVIFVIFVKNLCMFVWLW